MTPAGLAELKADEGCRLLAYDDARPNHVPTDHDVLHGTLTIGYGYTGPDVHIGLRWTQAQADAALARRVAGFEADVAKALPWSAALDPVRRDVLAQLAYNLGIKGLLGWPVTLAAIKRHDWPAASADILNNRTWCAQVGRRAGRIAHALLTGSWP